MRGLCGSCLSGDHLCGRGGCECRLCGNDHVVRDRRRGVAAVLLSATALAGAAVMPVHAPWRVWPIIGASALALGGIAGMLTVMVLDVLDQEREGLTTYGEFLSDPGRDRSPEVDFGVWWCSGAREWPRWRVSWVRDTGEFYALEQTGGDPAAQRVVVLGQTPAGDDEAAEQALHGWADHCGAAFGIEWVKNRLESCPRRRAGV